MKTFTEPLKELKEFETLSAGVHDLRGIAQISGCIDAAKPHIMYSVNNGSGNRIIVTFRSREQKKSMKNIVSLIRRQHIILQKISCFTSRISVEMCLLRSVSMH